MKIFLTILAGAIVAAIAGCGGFVFGVSLTAQVYHLG